MQRKARRRACEPGRPKKKTSVRGNLNISFGKDHFFILDTLCDVFLIYKVPRYEIKGKGLLQTLNKYYLVDPCFREIRIKREMIKERSHWLENVVYLELVRRYRDVLIGKKGNLEVNFVHRQSTSQKPYPSTLKKMKENSLF